MAKYSLCLCKLQCQKRWQNTPPSLNDSHPKTYQAKTQSARSRSSRLPTLPQLEAIPRPRLLVCRAQISLPRMCCYRLSEGDYPEERNAESRSDSGDSQKLNPPQAERGDLKNNQQPISNLKRGLCRIIWYRPPIDSNLSYQSRPHILLRNKQWGPL